MCRLAWLSTCLVIMCLPYSCQQTYYYTITLPRQMQANSVYIVGATYHGFSGGGSSPLKVNIKIQKNDDTATTKEEASGSVSIPPGSTKQLPIKLGAFSPGNYLITATLSGPLNGVKTQYVNLGSKTFSTFIQTDKALYQPSQLVQFRVVVVDPDLIPYQKETLTVQIKDPQDNIIQQWNEAPRDRGVFHSDLQLSDQPVMGDWKIIAQIGDDNSNQDKITEVTFTVKEYVLPQFEVTVITPYVTFNDNSNPTFTIIVTAKYTFGGPVNGNLDLSLEMPYCPRTFNCVPKSLKVKVPIEGTAQVTVKASDLYDETPKPQLTSRVVNTEGKMVIIPKPLPPVTDENRDVLVNVVAVVTEGLTGIQRNQTTSMTIYAKDEKLTLTQADNFKPGLPFEVTVKLTRQDGQPIGSAANEPVILTTNFDASGTTTPLNSVFRDGVAVFTIVPPQTQTSLTVTATYKTLQNSATISAVKAIPNSTKFITINVKTKTPAVGKKIDIEVQTTFEMKSPLSYVVVGRGNIRTSGSLPTSGQKTATFSFPVTSFMAPHARMVVYYTELDGGEMIADSVDISVGGTFRNSVSLKTSTDNLEPGKNVTLTLKTKPNSLVAVQGVDMSVLLLQKGNDITQGKVFNELQKYDNLGTNVVYDNDFFFVGFWRRPNYGGTFEQIFEYAGVFLVTNGNYYITPIWRPWWRFREGMFPMAMGNVDNDVLMFKGVDIEREASTVNKDTEKTVEPTRVRTLFPETFIWITTNTTKDGSVILMYTVPDTISTWVVDAYATNAKYGLGIMETPKNITVYRKFFIVMNLPYSVVNKEIITIQILVFNYDKNQQKVTVTLKNDKNEYIFINKQEENVKISNNTAVSTKNAKANGATAFAFQIQPTTVGQVSLNVKATSKIAGDAIIKQLLVKAEGSTEYFNKAVIIDLRKGSTFTTDVQLNIPKEAINGSEYIQFSAIGDFMAPVLSNIKELIRMPSGCGEQNMINFVPDVFVMKYLQSTNSLNSDINETLLNYLNQGYQRELTYKRNDGSYSAFGNSDSAGSTWLTAFVLKSFNAAKPYITIDDKVTYEAKKYLVSKQKSTGEFQETGKIIHTTLQGGSAAGVGLTAFCLIAFLEDKSAIGTEFVQAVDLAVGYLENLLDSIDSVYDLAIVAYALQLAPNSQKKDKAFTLLTQNKTQEGDLVYWKSSIAKPSGSYSYYSQPSSYDVEATAYALLCFGIRGLSEESLPILRWMISKRNSLGGYSSSQDTVIGVQALATVGGSFKGQPNSTVTITISYNGMSQSYNLNKKNSLVTQITPLPKTVRTIKIDAEGNGIGIAQISWNYNVYIKDPKPAFNVATKVKPTGKQSYSLTVCASNQGKGTNNMILIEMNTLSSYKWDQGSLPGSNSQPLLKRSELSEGGTRASFYFDNFPVTNSDTCVTANTISSGDVTNFKDATVSVYDYSLPYRRKDAYYNFPKTENVQVGAVE